MAHTYKHPRPSVTADLIILRECSEGNREVLLIKRANEPCKGYWAFPGGFVDENEDLEVAARRELAEETGLTAGELNQLGAFGRPGRDPRGHTITVVYWGFAQANSIAKAADDAEEAEWFLLDNLPALAFDHQEIIDQFSTQILDQK